MANVWAIKSLCILGALLNNSANAASFKSHLKRNQPKAESVVYSPLIAPEDEQVFINQSVPNNHYGTKIFYIPIKLLGTSAYFPCGYEIHPAIRACYYQIRKSSPKTISCEILLSNSAIQTHLKQAKFWDHVAFMAPEKSDLRNGSKIHAIFVKTKMKPKSNQNFAERHYEVHPFVNECFYSVAGASPKRISCDVLLKDNSIIDALKKKDLLDMAQKVLQ